MKQLRFLLALFFILATTSVQLRPTTAQAAPLAQSDKPTAATQTIADAQLQQAITLYENGNLSQALSTFTSAHLLFKASADLGKSAMAMIYIGRVKMALEDTAGAQLALADSSQILSEVADDTDLTETYIALGDLAMMLEEFEQANDAYQKALAVAREDDEVDQRIVRAKIREVAFVQNVNSAEAELATYRAAEDQENEAATLVKLASIYA
ncbi:MAG: hypothetical protein KDE31_05370, partial [Caldilineaceae bacterium]|nr:hypothetical protein [Caldilineaceae bacterium]